MADKTEKVNLVIELPDAKTPGYLKRLIARDKFFRQLEAAKEGLELPADYYDNLIEFILGFVAEPEDRAEARGLLVELSFEQYQVILNEITEAQGNPTSPEPSKAS